MSANSTKLLLIKNGLLITASDTVYADLLIQGEKISLIGQALNFPDAEVIDAQSKLVMPGGIDPHTHFDLPMFGTISSDDHYTGHKAAAFGGVTTVLDFVSQDYPTLEQSIQAWHEKADKKAAIDFGFHMNFTHLNDDLLAELAYLPDWGVSSIKVFTAYNNRLRLTDGEITRALQIAKASGLLTLVHAENGDVIDLLIAQALAAGHTSPEWHAHTRPAWSAVEATLRAASLSAITQAPMYIVHMNAGGEVDQLEYARQHGAPVMGETCTQYLFFGVEHLQRPDGAKWVCSPPVRSQADQERLWQGLASGSIQVVATDHCPFFFDGRREIEYEGKPVAIPGKELGQDDFTKIPNGLPGVGDRLPILWTYGVGHGRINANQFVALTSTNPAKIFGLYPQKGALLPGSDADIVIWDPQRTLAYGVQHAHHRTDYNLYEGWELTGFPEKVFLRGQLIVDGLLWLGNSGMGRFIPRQTNTMVL
jgi:dihydropyrimidinase